MRPLAILLPLVLAGCASVWPASIFFLRRDPTEIETGTPAPQFALAAADGRTVTLGDLLGKGRAVLVFYRGAF